MLFYPIYGDQYMKYGSNIFVMVQLSPSGRFFYLNYLLAAQNDRKLTFLTKLGMM